MEWLKYIFEFIMVGNGNPR